MERGNSSCSDITAVSTMWESVYARFSVSVVAVSAYMTGWSYKVHQLGLTVMMVGGGDARDNVAREDYKLPVQSRLVGKI